MKRSQYVLGMLKLHAISRRPRAVLRYSADAFFLLTKLQERGFISNFSVEKRLIYVTLRLGISGYHIFRNYTGYSKPGRTVVLRYKQLVSLDKAKSWLFATPHGFLWREELLSFGQGGQLICCL